MAFLWVVFTPSALIGGDFLTFPAISYQSIAGRGLRYFKGNFSRQRKTDCETLFQENSNAGSLYIGIPDRWRGWHVQPAASRRSLLDFRALAQEALYCWSYLRWLSVTLLRLTTSAYSICFPIWVQENDSVRFSWHSYSAHECNFAGFQNSYRQPHLTPFGNFYLPNHSKAAFSESRWNIHTQTKSSKNIDRNWYSFQSGHFQPNITAIFQILFMFGGKAESFLVVCFALQIRTLSPRQFVTWVLIINIWWRVFPFPHNAKPQAAPSQRNLSGESFESWFAEIWYKRLRSID